jgi:hypothetical protein
MGNDYVSFNDGDYYVSPSLMGDYYVSPSAETVISDAFSYSENV